MQETFPIDLPARRHADRQLRPDVRPDEDQGELSLYRHRRDVSRCTYSGRTGYADPAPTIVVYHHVTAERDAFTDGLGIGTHPDVLRRHLRYFRSNFDLVSQSDLFGAKLPRRPLLITFDDLYRSVLDVAGPLLREAGAPAIQFLNAACLDGESVPVDNLLACAVAGLGARSVQAILGMQQARPLGVDQMIALQVSRLGPAHVAQARARIITALATTELKLRRTTSLFLTAGDVPALARYGIDVGNHSMNHVFFRARSAAELTDEIAGGRAALEAMAGRPVHCLSVPYGHERDATPEALGVARASGHRAIFLVHGRSNRRRLSPDIYYRTNLRQVPDCLLPVVLRGLPELRGLRRQAWSSSAPAARLDMP